MKTLRAVIISIINSLLYGLVPCAAQDSSAGGVLTINSDCLHPANSGTLIYRNMLNDRIDAQPSSYASGGALVLFNGTCTQVDSNALPTSAGSYGQTGAGILASTNNQRGPVVLNGSGTAIISGTDGGVVNSLTVRIEPLPMPYQLENQIVVLDTPTFISTSNPWHSGGAVITTGTPGLISHAGLSNFLWEVSKNNGGDWKTIGSETGDDLSYGSGTGRSLVIGALKTGMTGWRYRVSADVSTSGSIYRETSEPLTLNVKPSYIKGPAALAIDSTNNLYVADPLTNAIWKIFDGNKAGVFAGSTAGMAGATNATGTNARFNHPQGVAMHDGKFYVADTGNNAIRVIAADGSVTLLAGAAGQPGDYAEGTGAAARFDKPTALTVDAGGNVYVIDSGNNMVRKITPAGVTSHIAGDRFAWGETLKTEVYIMLDDYNNSSASTVDLTMPTKRAAPDDTRSTVGYFSNEKIIGDLIISANTTISDGVSTVQSATLAVSESGYFSNMIAVTRGRGAHFSGNIYRNARSMPQSQSPQDSLQAGSYYFNMADGIALSPDGKKLYVANTLNAHVCKIDLASRDIALFSFGIYGADWNATSFCPRGMAFDKNGNLFVADAWNSVIVMFDRYGLGGTYAGIMSNRYYSSGTFISTVGTTPKVYLNSFADGAADAALFDTPSGVAVDSAGNIYVADRENAAIRKITQSGTSATVTTLLLEAASVQYPTGTTSNPPPSGNTDSGNTDSGGGGGALSPWCLLALGALAALRLRSPRTQAHPCN